MQSFTEIPGGLEALSQRVKRELQILSWPAKEWVLPVVQAPCDNDSNGSASSGSSSPRVRPTSALTDSLASCKLSEAPKQQDGHHVYDVLIVGGGQCGLATAFGLMRERVTNITCVDENPAGLEGPWITYARMITLRTPKGLTGLEYGMPNLSFPAYFEARFGLEAWDTLDKIPRQMWAEYLAWYRQVLSIPVRNSVRVRSIAPLDQAHESPTLFKVVLDDLTQPGTTVVMHARKVVLATGIQGGGEWHVPSFIKQAVPKHLYAHTSEAVDFAKLRGKRIAILGGGASAFDNAQFALGEGVGQVDVFVRREDLPRVNPIRFMEQAGFLKHFAELDDATKYQGISFFMLTNQPPTNDTYNRACAYPNFQLHLASPWTGLRVTDTDQVLIDTPKGQQGPFDYLIVSTGLMTDAKLRPELQGMAHHIATWADKFNPDERGIQRNPLIDAHPYLSPCFEFTEKTPGCAPYLRGLFAYNYSALASLGLSASALSGVRFTLPKLITGITRQLFMEQAPTVVSDYLSYKEEEFKGVWPPAQRTDKQSTPTDPSTSPQYPPDAQSMPQGGTLASWCNTRAGQTYNPIPQSL